jgi:hypothetical protein
VTTILPCAAGATDPAASATQLISVTLDGASGQTFSTLPAIPSSASSLFPGGYDPACPALSGSTVSCEKTAQAGAQVDGVVPIFSLEGIVTIFAKPEITLSANIQDLTVSLAIDFCVTVPVTIPGFPLCVSSIPGSSSTFPVQVFSKQLDFGAATCPPPPGPPVVVEFTADYDLATFDSGPKATVMNSLASFAGVDASAVTVTAVAGSVKVTATILTGSSAQQTNIKQVLTSSLTSTSAASTILGVTVTSTPVIDPTTPGGGGGGGGGCDGGCIAGAVIGSLSGVILIGFIIFRVRQRQAEGKQGCVPKFGGQSEDNKKIQLEMDNPR